MESQKQYFNFLIKRLMVAIVLITILSEIIIFFKRYF